LAGKPAFVTGDSWYSGVDNLKRVKNTSWVGWLFVIESKRTVSAIAPCIALPTASVQEPVYKDRWDTNAKA
jgi:hypothetical protein